VSPKKGTKRKAEETVSDQDVNKAKVAKLSLADTLYEDSWKNVLSEEFKKPYFKKIEDYVNSARQSNPVHPAHEDVFNALNLTPLDKVRVVILGQDPYFNEGQAHGLSFSVKKGVKVPPSLNRMYKVLEKTVPGFKKPNHGFLEEWAKRGVLLLNATLTVNGGAANSHAKCGWQDFTDVIIKVLNEKRTGIVFFLWGGFAQKKGKIIDATKHHVLNGPHPSPMSGEAWNSCLHFKEANEILVKEGKEPIDWSLSA